MKEFTKDAIIALRTELEPLLVSLGDKHGIKLSIGTITYSANKFTCRMTGLAGGVVSETTNHEDLYALNATSSWVQKLYGFKEDMVGKEITDGRLLLVFVGINRKSKKYPYIFKNKVSGKLYSYQRDDAMKLLEMMGEVKV